MWQAVELTFLSGRLNRNSRSKRPGLLSAGSIESSLFVAPMTTISPRLSRPSIKASRVDTIELHWGKRGPTQKLLSDACAFPAPEHCRRVQTATQSCQCWEQNVQQHTICSNRKTALQIGHRNKDKIHVDTLMGQYKSWTKQRRQKQLNCFHYIFGFIFYCDKKKNPKKKL